MRVLTLLALLAATFSLVLSSIIPPPDALCHPGTQRCHKNTLEECTTLGHFKPIQACNEHETCTITSTTTDNSPYGECASLQPISTSNPNVCPTVGHERCNANNMLEQCNAQHIWKPVRKCEPSAQCTQYSDTNQAYCITRHAQLPREYTPPPPLNYTAPLHPRPSPSSLTLPSSSQFPPSPIPSFSAIPAPPLSTPLAPEPCTPGAQTCSSDYYTVMKCGEDRLFHTEMKCYRVADCKILGEGKAVCERGGTRPPGT